jgi:hypothetical protein
LFGEGHTIAHNQAGAKLSGALPHPPFGDAEALGDFIGLVDCW